MVSKRPGPSRRRGESKDMVGRRMQGDSKRCQRVQDNFQSCLSGQVKSNGDETYLSPLSLVQVCCKCSNKNCDKGSG